MLPTEVYIEIECPRDVFPSNVLGTLLPVANNDPNGGVHRDRVSPGCVPVQRVRDTSPLSYMLSCWVPTEVVVPYIMWFPFYVLGTLLLLGIRVSCGGT